MNCKIGTLREKRPSTELFLVRNFLLFGPQITPYLDTYHAVAFLVSCKKPMM